MAPWIDTKLDLWHSETGKNMGLTTRKRLPLWQKWLKFDYFSPLLPLNLGHYTKWISKMPFSMGIWKKRSIRAYHRESPLHLKSMSVTYESLFMVWSKLLGHGSKLLGVAHAQEALLKALTIRPFFCKQHLLVLLFFLYMLTSLSLALMIIWSSRSKLLSGILSI